MLLPASELVLDPALQCRAEENQEAIADYAAAYQANVTLPAIEVFEVDGKHFVVDGFHRTRGALAARRDRLPCVVHRGTRRDAMLAAVRANASHGLRRTNADKRRAVRVLLMDPEWCKLSSRDMGTFAGVSHVFVQDVRFAYGVDKGQVLSAEHQARVDGEAPPAWKEILSLPRAFGYEIERIRKAAGPRELVTELVHGGPSERAVELRWSELAVEPWPWPEDTTPAARAARAAAIDTVEDLDRALRAIDCPDAERLRDVLAQALRIPALEYEQRDVQAAVAGRPRLEAAYAERIARGKRLAAERAEREATKDPEHWFEWTAKLRGVKDDPARQRPWWDRVLKLKKDLRTQVLDQLCPADLHPDLREAFRQQVAPGERIACVDPRCDGWCRPWARSAPRCVRCNRDEARVRHDMAEQLRNAARLLEHPGFGVRSFGVTLDRATLDLLGELQITLARNGAELVAAAPPELARQLRAWKARPAPEVLLVDLDASPAPKEP